MKRTGIRRKAPMSRAPLTTGRRRKPSEFARIYGSKARVAWVKTLPCVVPSCFRLNIENMHIETGGVGRKADYDKIVPCCHDHHEMAHRIGVRTFQAQYDISLVLAAIATEQRWQAHLYGGRGPEHISAVVARVMEKL